MITSYIQTYKHYLYKSVIIQSVTSPSGPCKVILGTPTSCSVRDKPGRPPMFLQVLLVIKMWSSLDSFTLCSCASRCVHSPQLNKYLWMSVKTFYSHNASMLQEPTQLNSLPVSIRSQTNPAKLFLD